MNHKKFRHDVKHFLIEKEITQEAFCETVNMNPSTFSQKLNGHREFTVKEIEKIASAIGREPGEYLERQSTPPPAIKKPEVVMNAWQAVVSDLLVCNSSVPDLLSFSEVRITKKIDYFAALC